MPDSSFFVSVLMAVYNGEKYISDAIASVLKQDYRNFELIIVDNGSDDDTQSIVRRFDDPRLKYFYLPEKGKNQAFNYAFERCTGSFICFFAADDLLPEDSISTRVRPLLNGDASYSTCLLKTLSMDVQYDNLIFPKNRSQSNYSGGSIFFSRAIGAKLFPIPVVFPNEDTWASLHLRAFGKGVHIQQPLYYYRIHGGNSYGYGLTFETKREKFVQRMAAFEEFKNKWAGIQNPFIDGYVADFAYGLQLFNNGQLAKIFLLKNISLGDKLKFLMFSSSFVFQLRNRFFRMFSGFVN